MKAQHFVFSFTQLFAVLLVLYTAQILAMNCKTNTSFFRCSSLTTLYISYVYIHINYLFRVKCRLLCIAAEQVSALQIKICPVFFGLYSLDQNSQSDKWHIRNGEANWRVIIAFKKFRNVLFFIEDRLENEMNIISRVNSQGQGGKNCGAQGCWKYSCQYKTHFSIYNGQFIFCVLDCYRLWSQHHDTFHQVISTEE